MMNNGTRFFPLARGGKNPYVKPGGEARFFKLEKGDKGSSLKAKAANDKDELKKSCDDFEAVLLNFLMAEMRKTVKKNDLFGEASFSSETFTSFLDSEIAKNIAGSGALGISESMYDQLTNTMPGSRSGIGYGK
jgi:flagellar protein FlgJ